MEDIPEFTVETIGPGDNSWQFLEEMQRLDSIEIQTLNGGIKKKFMSLATNATIFRWKFGDGQEIETHTNPYIHTYANIGTYFVSHQSCYPCIQTGTLTCSNGWCTKSINVEIIERNWKDFAALSLGGFFIAILEDTCKTVRIVCQEEKKKCAKIGEGDIKGMHRCRTIDNLCKIRLENCARKEEEKERRRSEH